MDTLEDIVKSEEFLKFLSFAKKIRPPSPIHVVKGVANTIKFMNYSLLAADSMIKVIDSMLMGINIDEEDEEVLSKISKIIEDIEKAIG